MHAFSRWDGRAVPANTEGPIVNQHGTKNLTGFRFDYLVDTVDSVCFSIQLHKRTYLDHEDRGKGGYHVPFAGSI